MASEVRALYRAFLRVGSQWHPEPSKTGRSLHEAINHRVRAQFRALKDVSPSETPTLLHHGRLELTALEQLLHNEAKLQVTACRLFFFFNSSTVCWRKRIVRGGEIVATDH